MKTSTNETSLVIHVNSNFLSEPKKELAFEFEGVKYYHFTEGGTSIYFERFRALQDVMRKHEEWRVSDAVLTEFVDMVERLTIADKQQEVLELVQKMRWRRSQSNDLLLLYEIASIWYFDESEDPAVWDAAYSKIKIERWRKSGELFAFFLRTPLNRYIDFSQLSNDGMQNYLLELHLTLYAQSATNILRLSDKEKASDTGKNIAWLMETYSDLANLIDTGLRNTITT